MPGTTFHCSCLNGMLSIPPVEEASTLSDDESYSLFKELKLNPDKYIAYSIDSWSIKWKIKSLGKDDKLEHKCTCLICNQIIAITASNGCLLVPRNLLTFRSKEEFSAFLASNEDNYLPLYGILLPDRLGKPLDYQCLREIENAFKEAERNEKEQALIQIEHFKREKMAECDACIDRMKRQFNRLSMKIQETSSSSSTAKDFKMNENNNSAQAKEKEAEGKSLIQGSLYYRPSEGAQIDHRDVDGVLFAMDMDGSHQKKSELVVPLQVPEEESSEDPFEEEKVSSSTKANNVSPPKSNLSALLFSSSLPVQIPFPASFLESANEKDGSEGGDNASNSSDFIAPHTFMARTYQANPMSNLPTTTSSRVIPD